MGMKASLKQHETGSGVVAPRVWNETLSQHGLTKHPTVLKKAAITGQNVAWREVLGSLTFDVDTKSHKWANAEPSLDSVRPATSLIGTRKPMRLIDPTVPALLRKAQPNGGPVPKTKTPTPQPVVKPPHSQT